MFANIFISLQNIFKIHVQKHEYIKSPVLQLKPHLMLRWNESIFSIVNPPDQWPGWLESILTESSWSLSSLGQWKARKLPGSDRNHVFSPLLMLPSVQQHWPSSSSWLDLVNDIPVMKTNGDMDTTTALQLIRRIIQKTLYSKNSNQHNL